MRIRVVEGAIHAYCKHANITRPELARRLDIGYSTLRRIEEGSNGASGAFIGKFMKLTGSPFEKLFRLDDETTEAA